MPKQIKVQRPTVRKPSAPETNTSSPSGKKLYPW